MEVLFILTIGITLFCGVRVAQSLVFYVVFCRSLFVLLSFFFWPLYCLSFDLRFQITPFGIFLLFVEILLLLYKMITVTL